MEHITVTELENGSFKLVPDIGYLLRHRNNPNLFSEAIIKNRKEIRDFTAVAINE